MNAAIIADQLTPHIAVSVMDNTKEAEMRIRWMAAILVVSLVLLTTSAPTLAGTGSVVDGTPSYVNLNLYYTYTPSDLDVMRTAFEQASRLLFNSTNGQLCFGTIRVSTNSAFQNSADIWVNPGSGGANAHVGALGDPGLRILLFENTHRWTNEDGPLGRERGQFGIMHEFGHYGFNLQDEYPTTSATAGAFCVSTISTIACIMDGGTTVHPSHHRTEWCTPHAAGLTTDHVTSPLNPQQDTNGESCWETIADYCSSDYGITLTAPTTVDTSDPLSLPTLGWTILGDDLRYVIALDRSWSMSVDDKEPLAKQAAILFVDLCNPDSDEFISVVSFSDTIIAELPMTGVTSTPDTKGQAIAAINGVTLDSSTAMGDGLRESLSQITGGGSVPVEDSVVEAIVLLSDGVHNDGSEAPIDVLPDLISRGVRVFSIGLGSSSHATYPLDEATLLNISDKTGGSYTHALNATDLAAIYTNYAAEVRGTGTAPEAEGELGPAGERIHEFWVDQYTVQQTFVLHWPYGYGAFNLAIIDPNGSTLDASAFGISRSRQGFHDFYRIDNPMTGMWQVVVRRTVSDIEFPGVSDNTTLAYTVQALADSPNLSFHAAMPSRFVDPCKWTTIRAAVYADGVPVARATVTGTIEGPDGSIRRLRLYDDGDLQSHRDDFADDGTYTAIVCGFPQPGTYTVRLTVDCIEGVQAVSTELGVPPVSPMVRKRIGRFTRSTVYSFRVVSEPGIPTPCAEGSETAQCVQ